MQLRFNEKRVVPRHLNSNLTPVPPREPDRSEIIGHKGSIFYRAHSYHTKVPPEGIARQIEHYTDPGDIIVDPFCGSGMTGLAALMTGRCGFISDLSAAATHIARGYTSPVDSAELRRAGEQLLVSLAPVQAELYGTSCPNCRDVARVEYTVWSDVFGCSACSREIVFWQSAVDAETGAIAKVIECSCGQLSAKRDLHWLRTEPVLESIACLRCKRVEREVDENERARIAAFDRSTITAWYPTAPFESWREMWRGQHRTQAIETAADFFTDRNLAALAELWAGVGREADGIRPALRFVFTAIVNRASRRYQWNPKRPTNVLSSTLYIASLSYEFNVFSLFRRKLKSAIALNAATSAMSGSAQVFRTPAQSLDHLPDQSVDYVFTDPPFGSNIFYTDSSFLWESWLDDLTDTANEAVVHRSQRAEHGGKSLNDYEKLMCEAFEEMARILRRNAWASVMFHNSSDEVWSALARAIDASGFEIGGAVAFDKSQASFKGLKGQLANEKVPNFDLVLHLRRRAARPRQRAAIPDAAAIRELVEARLIEHAADAPPSRRSTAYLHSLVMRILLEEQMPVDGFSYAAVETLCQSVLRWDGAAWTSNTSGKEQP